MTLGLSDRPRFNAPLPAPEPPPARATVVEVPPALEPEVMAELARLLAEEDDPSTVTVDAEVVDAGPWCTGGGWDAS